MLKKSPRLFELRALFLRISYPLCRNALMRYAKKLVDSGEFGKISMIRVRRSHNGVSGNWLVDYWFDTAKTGGGAMMDLGAHPMYLFILALRQA